MSHDLQQTIALLTRTPATLDALLRDLPEAWMQTDEGPNTWSVVEVVGHLIDSERVNWLPRARLILDFGESRSFKTFARNSHIREIEGKSMPQLLDEFSRLRFENFRELNALNLQATDLELRGVHPALGTVTLSHLLATWAIHDLTHITQITRVMAHQYRETVGPWCQYLGIIHRSAPSTT